MNFVEVFRKSFYLLAITVAAGVYSVAQEPTVVPSALPTATPTPVETTGLVTSSGKNATTTAVGVTDKTLEQSAEAKEILPYYQNYLTEYRLGPNDIISVEVFGQCPNYCISGKTIPPTARISYPLIREGVMVGGKTVEQVADEITKKLDEYIIDPKVTVTLERAQSARYSVIGKVTAPGVHVLDRRVSVWDAIVEAGNITKEADEKHVVIYSYGADGRLVMKNINLKDIKSGKIPPVYLNPGDQVLVPDRGFKITPGGVLNVLSQLSMVRFLFGSPL